MLLRARWLLVAVSAWSFLILVGPWITNDQAQAGDPKCDQRCAQQVKWFLASQDTAAKQWYGAVIANWPAARCVAQHESHGSYFAENAVSTASGKFQFLRGTGDNVNRSRGRFDLVGLPASAWPWWEQDAAFGWAWTHGLQSAWTGTGCN